MAGKTIAVPDIGGFEGVPVIEVLVAAGDRVEAEQPLIVLESDKSTMEIPAPEAGTIEALQCKVGDTVSEGSPICTLVPDAGDAPAPASEAPAAEPEPAPQPEPEPEPEAEPEPEPASASSPAPAQSTETVRVPDIGDFTDVPVIEVLIADGDTVEADQPIIVLESDKSTMEVPAPQAGTVGSVALKQGDKVSQGDVICELTVAGAAQPAPAPAQAPEPQPQSEPQPGPQAAQDEAPAAQTGDTGSAAQGPRMQPQSDGQLIPHASPAVRRFARELGVDLATVTGSGAKGRIVREDVQKRVKQALSQAPQATAPAGGGGLPAQPEVDFSRFGPVEEHELPRIRRISAQNLHRNWLLVPHVTQTDDADITDLEAFRKAESTAERKLTLLPFVIKAVGAALAEFPDFNSSLSADGQRLIRKQYCHVGFAADTPNGLLVPVVRDVWSKPVSVLAAECGALAAKARDGKLKPDEMQGGCFSISSLGGIGGSHFTPIVNAPEVAILGVSKASMQPVWDGEQFRPRLMCPLSLSYDHRVIDGAAAARFIVHVKNLLEDMRRIVL
ncbi:dihydrolipoyllysine-residue acetyltransferase [Algiphilus sp.]|uniref:dihydrolipoyllysine-residue acetyltransferase n=1 Tax=Algiphilus sp. TaxID=1872431 RepID=UPI0025BD3436|nr:dihydrolipoyllysine-residue acetyltransferase [Algiphilus sp.]MCK5769387.1 dihydrolipoyllysine-residue acetyltransferase [Algiphilus sp.]